jgi:hypothetical protein
MRWQCEYHNSKGLQCREPASIRLHFDPYTPFNHIDLCSVHEEDYPLFKWFQYISEGETLGEGIYLSKKEGENAVHPPEWKS